MSFFKEFKDDLSQAVNELLPQDEKTGENKGEEADDRMVNTLDDDKGADEQISDDEEMKELLKNFTMSDEEAGEDMKPAQTLPEESSTDSDRDLSDENKEEEGEEMDENVDLELIDVLNADEEKVHTEEVKDDTREKEVQKANEDEVTVITKGTTINGSISSDGSLDIMGTITGDVECLGKLSITGKVVGNSTASEVYVNTERLEGGISSEGSVKIALGTVVIGDVSATSGVIAGAVKGEIDVNGPVVIDSTAIIKGNIKAKSVQINNGAVVEGFCSLSYSDVDIDNIFE